MKKPLSGNVVVYPTLLRNIVLGCRRGLMWLLAAITGFASPLAQADQPPRVEAVQLHTLPLIEQIPVSGSVQTQDISRLSSQVSGLVKLLHVDVGDSVNAGDLLLELDSELTEIDLRRARAQLARAEQELSESQRRLREAQTLAEGSIAASDIRALEAQARISQSGHDEARAQADRLRAELERHQIRAPYSGTLSSRSVAAGEWVTPGNDLLELVSSEQLTLDFQIPQRYFARVTEQSEVLLDTQTLLPDSQNNDAVRAGIHRKVPLSQSGSRTFLLRASLPQALMGRLIPGMAMSGHLLVDTQRSGIAVPRDALVRYPDGRETVWVITEPRWGEPSQVREQRVETGLSFSGLIEVRSGLSDGAVVVTVGNEALQEGQRVIPEQRHKQPPTANGGG